jgi:peptidoglycan DL-endopeptidase LytE
MEVDQVRRNRLIRRAVLVAAGAALLPTPAALAHTPSDYRLERTHIESRARAEIGDPYSSGGTSPSGFDCSGFTRWVFQAHGANLPHSSAAQFSLGSRKGYTRVWKRTKVETGDLVFFKTTYAHVGHVGIYIGNGKFISSTSSSGVKVDSIYDSYYWGSRWVGAVRPPVTTRFRDSNTHRGHGDHWRQLV